MHKARSVLGGWGLLVPLLLLPLAGCCTSPLGSAIQTVKNQLKASDVALILLDTDMSRFPDTLIVRSKVHVVVWIAEADELQIEFKDPTQTGGVKNAPCSKNLCYFGPFDLPSGTQVKYKATLKCKSKDPVVIDPMVEIVP